MNWFKKLSIYRITDSEFQRQLRDGISDACLAEREARRVFGHEHFTEGFCCPVGDDGPLAYSANGFLLLAVRREERILPGGVVRDALKEKVQEIEAQQMRKVYKKERDQLKDEIIHSLLPRVCAQDRHPRGRRPCCRPDLRRRQLRPGRARPVAAARGAGLASTASDQREACSSRQFH